MIKRRKNRKRTATSKFTKRRRKQKTEIGKMMSPGANRRNEAENAVDSAAENAAEVATTSAQDAPGHKIVKPMVRLMRNDDTMTSTPKNRLHTNANARSSRTMNSIEKN